MAIAYLKDPDRLIIAVADGVSSARQSHLGATIAVRQCVQLLVDRVVTNTEVDWEAIFRLVAWQLVEQCGILFPGVDEARKPEEAERLLATTLVAAVITVGETVEPRIQAAAIGDSEIWTVTGGKFATLLGGKNSSNAEFMSSRVSGLPRISDSIAQIDLVVSRDSILLVGTDGIGDPLGTGDGSVGLTLARALESSPSLLDFGRLVDFSRETFDDDRTLVSVAFHSGASKDHSSV